MLRVLKKTSSFLLGGLIVAAFMLVSQRVPSGSAQVVFAQAPQFIPEAPNAGPQLLFQGQLSNPSTGQPVIDGAYAMTFHLYNTAAGGSPLWTETKQVNTTSGLFATLLGSVTALNAATFNGQQLYLGIQVSGDPEAAPRQPIGYTAYAIRADNASNADRLDGLEGSDFVRLGNDGVVAFGIIDADGSRVSGVRFSSGRAGSGIYEITIDGEDYNLNQFATVVTPIDNDQCPGPVIAKTGSNGGKLNVYLFNLSSQIIGCKFHFVTFET